MSLGLLSGYGSDSDSENEEESPSIEASSSSAVINRDNSNSDNLRDRLKVLSDGGVGMALTLPPPPPPPSEIPEVLPNPMRDIKPKKKKLPPGMSKKEAAMLENAKWLDIITEDAPEDGQKPEFEYNTPLPFSRERQTESQTDEESGAAGTTHAMTSQPEYDYLSYVAEYQNYMAHSAALMEGQERARQLAAQAAASGDSGAGEAGPSVNDTGQASNSQLWEEYMTKYAQWYAQYGAGGSSGSGAPSQPAQPQLRQKTFEELLEQDRQLDAYFNSEPPNEYNTQRDAFKSSFRGTRRYRMLNGGNYNARHFNQLSSGAKKFSEMYPKQKSVIEDKDAYVADKDLPENQDIKSNKQRKKDKWFQGMVEKKKGCKKCGFVFCRCFGWEFKPSHVK